MKPNFLVSNVAADLICGEIQILKKKYWNINGLFLNFLARRAIIQYLMYELLVFIEINVASEVQRTACLNSPTKIPPQFPKINIPILPSLRIIGRRHICFGRSPVLIWFGAHRKI